MSTETGQGASPATPSPTPQPELIGIEDFQRIQLKIGTILTAEDHPKADRLLILTVDIGEAAPRKIVAGIKATYQPADLIGSQVVVVANMKPAVLRGVESQGMVLAASSDAAMILVAPKQPVSPGIKVK